MPVPPTWAPPLSFKKLYSRSFKKLCPHTPLWVGGFSQRAVPPPPPVGWERSVENCAPAPPCGVGARSVVEKGAPPPCGLGACKLSLRMLGLGLGSEVGLGLGLGLG